MSEKETKNTNIEDTCKRFLNESPHPKGMGYLLC